MEVDNKKTFYAVYKGSKYVFDGTKDEVCKFMNIKPATFNYYKSKYYIKNRQTKKNNRIIIIQIS